MGAPPARLVYGFESLLPGRTRMFFQRQFVVNYPRPIQQAGPAPFPRTVPIVRIKAPNRQAIVLRSVAFNAYQHSGIGVEDLAEVPFGRSFATLGFSIKVGNRGLTDFFTNLPGSGVPVVFSPIQAGQAAAPRSGQGIVRQGTGLSTPPATGENWAAYVMPGEPIAADAIIFRPPSFDLRLMEVTMSGWLADEQEVEKIIDRLSR